MHKYSTNLPRSALELMFEGIGASSSLGRDVVTEVVLSTLLLEEVELLEGLESVDSEGKVSILGHTESLHVLLNLNIVVDGSVNVVSI